MDLKQLEFHHIIHRIERLAKTIEAKRRIRALYPLKHPEEAMESMSQINTAKAFIEENKTPFFGDFLNITTILKDIKIQRVLTVSDLVMMHQFTQGIYQISRKLSVAPEKISHHGLLSLIDAITDIKPLRLKMSQMLDEEGIKSDATPALKSLNQQKIIAERRLQEKLKNLVNRHQDHLSESFFTERFNRYVVPVKLSYKNKFKGSVVDYSASGETVYMEPFDVAEHSAQIRQLSVQIDDEIKAILKELSHMLNENYVPLNTNFEMATQLDIIFAKAHYAIDIDAGPIQFGKKLNIIAARHPLIPKDDVVANTIAFKESEKIMIISGSNTGGKTVVLKTVGLLSLMALSGLLIPASKSSVIPFYHQIYADIGDEQSIEQSLSTFSSHMTHIIKILENTNENALLLFDEIGGGTDPKAGAALSRALLDELRKKDVHVFVTTHYSELKAYAYEHPSVVNASVAFNKETLQPTYHLYTHTPGESHAFLIAKRLGLNTGILRKAEAYLHDEQNPISNLVLKLEATKNALEEDKKNLERLIQDHETLKKQTESLLIETQDKKQALTDIFNQKLQNEKAKLKALFDDQIKALKKNATLKPHEINHAKSTLFKLEPSSEKVRENRTYKVGDAVLVHKYNRPGKLMKRLSEKTWLVSMGTLETRLEDSAFSYLESSPKSHKKNLSKSPTIKKHVSPECDLRGLRVLDAKETLLKYLDDCLLAKLPFARIIHGFGTLAVRNMVKEELKINPLVSSFRDGGNNEGGQGVTVVYF